MLDAWEFICARLGSGLALICDFDPVDEGDVAYRLLDPAEMLTPLVEIMNPSLRPCLEGAELGEDGSQNRSALLPRVPKPPGRVSGPILRQILSRVHASNLFLGRHLNFYPWMDNEEKIFPTRIA